MPVSAGPGGSAWQSARFFMGLLVDDLTVTVGSGGDYSTINGALDALTNRRPPYVSGGVAVTVHLLAGFTMSEQVIVKGLDLGWITITAADRPVTVARSSVTTADAQSRLAAFMASEGATLPVIACRFNMDSSGEAGSQGGILLTGNSDLIVRQGTALLRNGFTGAAYRNLNIQEGSRAAAAVGDFSSAGDVGIRVANGSVFDGAYVKATGCTVAGVSVGGAHANVDNADLSGNTGIGINATGAATVSAATADVSGSGTGVNAAQAATVNAQAIDATSCTVGLRAEDGGRINASDGSVNGSGAGISAREGGYIDATDATANDCTGNAVLSEAAWITFVRGDATGAGATALGVTRGGTLLAPNATATGATTYGAYCEAGFLDVQSSNVQKGGSTSSSDAVVALGGTINAHSMTGGLSKTANTVTAAGIIYQ